jgi:hypothetical protein
VVNFKEIRGLANHVIPGCFLWVNFFFVGLNIKHGESARIFGTSRRQQKTSYARNGNQVVQNVGVEHLYFPSISLPAR